jgi:hypothetical protein
VDEWRRGAAEKGCSCIEWGGKVAMFIDGELTKNVMQLNKLSDSRQSTFMSSIHNTNRHYKEVNNSVLKLPEHKIKACWFLHQYNRFRHILFGELNYPNFSSNSVIPEQSLNKRWIWPWNNTDFRCDGFSLLPSFLFCPFFPLICPKSIHYFLLLSAIRE